MNTKKTLLQLHKVHIASSIQRYLSSNKCSLDAAAKALDLKRSTFGDWSRQVTIPSWSNYFDLMIRMEPKGSEKQNVDAYVDEFSTFFRDSILSYSLGEGLSYTTAPTQLGTTKKTLEAWVEGNLPVAADSLVVLDTIYSSRNSQNECADFLKGWRNFNGKKYRTLIARLRSDSPETSAASIGEIVTTPAEATSQLHKVYEQLLSLTDYFKDAGVPARDMLRKIPERKKKAYVLACLHARQLLRDEEKYQQFLTDNVYTLKD